MTEASERPAGTTRQRLVAAASHHFAHRFYSMVSLDDILAAGCSKPWITPPPCRSRATGEWRANSLLSQIARTVKYSGSPSPRSVASQPVV